MRPDLRKKGRKMVKLPSGHWVSASKLRKDKRHTYKGAKVQETEEETTKGGEHAEEKDNVSELQAPVHTQESEEE